MARVRRVTERTRVLELHPQQPASRALTLPAWTPVFIRLYELAPNHAIAQYGLGCLYRYGYRVSQDKNKAMEFYCKSVEQECPLGLLGYAIELHEAGRVKEAQVSYYILTGQCCPVPFRGE